ncbi:Yqey-like protein-domain-containing protein [Xylaria sp. CBS 124048]|nr:Yqey-like protein-domain-containing protein [Xylaria sp. CBS 124048]
MSLRPSMRIATHLLRAPPARLTSPAFAFTRFYSDDAVLEEDPTSGLSEDKTPPLLLKLKGDLKTALREKDIARLSVLRNVLTATQTASKSPKPIRTDAALVALIIKQARAANDAKLEFSKAGRMDLVDKEAAQIAILEEYASGSGVEKLNESQLKAIVQETLATFEEKPKLGQLLKHLCAVDGPLADKAYLKASLVQIVKRTLKTPAETA